MAALTIMYRLFAIVLFALKISWLVVIAPITLVRELVLLVWRIARSYGALAPVIAFFAVYYVVSLQVTTNQEEVFQAIDKAWECDLWQFAYLFKQLWVLVEAAFDFLLPIYNPVVDWLRDGFYTMVSEIAAVADPASFSGVWESVNAVVKFLVHVVNTTHSDDGVDETEVPFFTDPFWNRVLEIFVCSINFLANLVQSQSELLFSQPCTSCDTLSAEACTCIRTMSSVFDFRQALPVYTGFFDGLVDYVCCFTDSLIGLAQALVQIPAEGIAWALGEIRTVYDSFMNQCVRDLVRTFLGYQYGTSSLTPMTDRLIEIVHCPNDALLLAMELLAQESIASVVADPLLIENSINAPLIDKSAVCLTLFWDAVVLGPALNDTALNGGPLRPFVEDGVEAYRLWARLANKVVFGVFANGTADTLKANQDEFWDDMQYTWYFLLGIQTGWNSGTIFPKVVRFVVAVGRAITYFVLRWICLTLDLASPLDVTLIDRTTDLSDLLQVVFHGLFGETSEFYGGASFTGAPVNVIFTRFADIFANTGAALFYMVRTLSFSTFPGDVPVNLGLWSDILEDSVLMVTDDVWPESTANVAASFRCHGEAFATALTALESTSGSVDDFAQASIDVCSCYTGTLRNLSAGVSGGDFTDRLVDPLSSLVQCTCEQSVGIALRAARLELLAHDPVFCSHSLVSGANGGNCTAAAAEPDVIRELLLCPCTGVATLLEEQLPFGGAGAVVGPLADSVCTVFVDWALIVRPILAGASSQSAPEASTYFADSVSVFFTCLDDLLTLASGGSVTSFLQWFWEWSGLAYLFGLITCAFQPVINEGVQGYLFANPADFTLNGTVPHCDFVTRVYDPYQTCVAALPDQPSPLNPINAVASVFDTVFRAIVTRLESMVCCMHDMWYDVLFNAGATFCSSDCLVCSASLVDLSDLPTDLGSFDSLLAVVPVGGYAPAVASSMQSVLDTFYALFGSTPVDVSASMTLTPYNPPSVGATPIVIPAFDATPFCCVRGLIDCYAAQNADDPFTALATYLAAMWDAVQAASCALVDVLRVFRYAVDSIRLMLDTITSLLLISTSATLDGALLIAGTIVDVTAELLEITDFLTLLCSDLAGLTSDINANTALINTAFSQVEGAFASIDISSIQSALQVLCTDVVGIINDFIVNIYNGAITDIIEDLSGLDADIDEVLGLIPDVPTPSEIFDSIKGMIEGLVVDEIEDAIDDLCDVIPGCRRRGVRSQTQTQTLSEQYEEKIPGYAAFVEQKQNRFRTSRIDGDDDDGLMAERGDDYREYEVETPLVVQQRQQQQRQPLRTTQTTAADRVQEYRRLHPNATHVPTEVLRGNPVALQEQQHNKRTHLPIGSTFLGEIYVCLVTAGTGCSSWGDLNALSLAPGTTVYLCQTPQAVPPYDCATWSAGYTIPINQGLRIDLACTQIVGAGCDRWNSFSDGTAYAFMDWWATLDNVAKIHCASSLPNSPAPMVWPGCGVWARWFPINEQTLYHDGVCINYDFDGTCSMNNWISAREISPFVATTFDLCREWVVSTINPLSQVVEYRCTFWESGRVWPVNGYVTGYWFCARLRAGRCVEYVSMNGPPSPIQTRTTCVEFFAGTDDCFRWEPTTSTIFQPAFPTYPYAGYVCRTNFAAGLCQGDWQELNSVNSLAPGTAINYCSSTGVGATHYQCLAQSTVLSKGSWWTDQVAVCNYPLWVPGASGDSGCEEWLPVNDMSPLPDNAPNPNDYVHCTLPADTPDYPWCLEWKKLSKLNSLPGPFVCFGYTTPPASANCVLKSWMAVNLIASTLGGLGQFCKGTDVTKTLCTVLGNDPLPLPGASNLFYLCTSRTGSACDEYLQTNGPAGDRRFVCTEYSGGFVDCVEWLLTDTNINSGTPYPPNGPASECVIPLSPLSTIINLPTLATVSLPVMGACSDPPGKRRRSSSPLSGRGGVNVTNSTLPVECLWLLDEELAHVPLDISMINETMYAIGDCQYAAAPVVANSSNPNATLANGTRLMLTRREFVLVSALILETIAVSPRLQKAYYTPPPYVNLNNETVYPPSTYVGYNMYEALTRGEYPLLRFIDTHDAARVAWQVSLRLSIWRLNATMDLASAVCTDVLKIASPVMMRLKYEDPSSPLADEGWVVYTGCWRLWVMTAASRHTPLFPILEPAYMNANIDSLTTVLQYAENVVEANTARKRTTHTHVHLNASRLYTESEASIRVKNSVRLDGYAKRRLSLREHYQNVSRTRFIRHQALFHNSNSNSRRTSASATPAPTLAMLRSKSKPRHVILKEARERMQRFSARYRRVLPPPSQSTLCSRRHLTYMDDNITMTTRIVHQGVTATTTTTYMFVHDEDTMQRHSRELYNASTARVKMPKLPTTASIIDRAFSTPGFVDEFTRRNISTHLLRIGGAVLDIARIKWTPKVRQAERAYEEVTTTTPRTLERRSLHEAITGFPLHVDSVDGTFNVNTWLIKWWDDFLWKADQSTGIPFGATWLSDHIARLLLLVEELLLWLFSVMDRVSNPLVCDGEAEYASWSVYKLKCIPNIPYDVLSPLTDLVDLVFQRQFFLFDVFETSDSCVQPNEEPFSNCGEADGGNRPLCDTCDWCERSYRNCVTDVGFGDVGDVVAFSIAVIPRALNILFHPVDEIGAYVNVNAVFVASLLMPTIGTLVLLSVAFSVLLFLPVASYFMPQLWIVVSALFLLTSVFTFPDIDFNAIEWAVKLTFALHNSGLFSFFVPDEWFKYTLTKLERFNYPDPAHSIPGIDVGCFVLTNGALLGLWVISISLLLPLALYASGATSRLAATLLTVFESAWSLLNTMGSASALDRNEATRQQVSLLDRRVSRLSKRVERRSDKEEGLLPIGPEMQPMPTGSFGVSVPDIESGGGGGGGDSMIHRAHRGTLL